MAAEAHGPTASEYIVHHLQHLQNIKQKSIVDFSVINYDSIVVGLILGVLALFVFWRAAKSATSGVPGRFQAAVEILVEMVDNQAKANIHNAESRKFIAPLALTVFVWIFLMNAMDMLPVDLLPVLWQGVQGDHHAYLRVVPTADLSTTLGLSFAVLIPWELSRRDPIVDMRLIFTRQFGTSFLVMMSVGAVLFSTTQLLPQLQQTTFDYTATLSGLSMMPGGIAMLMLMPVSGFASARVRPKYLIMIGMAAAAIGLWHLTSISGDATFSYFVYARILITVGLPFLFIPISTVAYLGLPPEKTNQASALINVARNIGGSIGVSLSNTVIAQHQQVHQSNLVAHTVQSSTAYQHTLRVVTDYFTARGAPALEAKAQAAGWIMQTIARQASLLAYVDVFRYAAVATALLVPLALLLHSSGHASKRR